jgi:hypothetical protein
MEQRLVIVSTVGLHRREDRPFAFDSGDHYRIIIPYPLDSGNLVISHLSIWDRPNLGRSGSPKLREALMNTCTVAPEFPTGNGKVDLHLCCGTKRGIIELKSFYSQGQLAQRRPPFTPASCPYRPSP